MMSVSAPGSITMAGSLAADDIAVESVPLFSELYCGPLLDLKALVMVDCRIFKDLGVGNPGAISTSVCNFNLPNLQKRALPKTGIMWFLLSNRTFYVPFLIIFFNWILFINYLLHLVCFL